MAGTFYFAPNSQVPTLIPPEPVQGMSLNGWAFTSKPTIPYVRKFKIMLHGMRWYLNHVSGMFDTVTDPYHNARLLELFYQENGVWDSFTYQHPHLGSLTCRFAGTVTIPEAAPSSGGLIEAFEVNLIEHNPGY